MAETQSPNYKWVKPDIGGDSAKWGTVLNTAIDAIDGVVFANQQAGLAIGSVSMFAGATAPANWLICNGASLPRTGGAYDALFGVIGATYGAADGSHFSLPNLVQRFPLGAGTTALGAAGGSFSISIGVANLPAHTHPITDPGHNHGANQWAHSHVISGGAHYHNINSIGNHHHGSNVMIFKGGSGQPLGIHGGVEANVTYGNTDDAGAEVRGGYTDYQSPAMNADTQTSNISIIGNTTGIAHTDNTGGGAAITQTQPYVALNFIIRFR